MSEVLLVFDDFNSLLWLQSLWTKAREGNKQAKDTLKRIGEALTWVGAGRNKELSKTEKLQSKRENTKRSKRRYDAAARLHLRDLRATLSARVGKLPRHMKSNR